MHVLVIGGTGFIGPHVVRRLRAGGHEVTLLHRGQHRADPASGVREVLGDRTQLESIAGDLRALAPEVVLDMFPYNGTDAQAVMTALHGVARRLVALSSQDVYRAYGRLLGIEPGPPDPVPLDEDALLRTVLHPYRGHYPGEDDYEKILAERVVLSDPDVPGTVLRLPMVYGLGDTQHRLFPYLKRMDDGRRAIPLDAAFADWRWTRGYVENVADAIALAVTDQRAARRVYNVGEPYADTLAEWVRRIGRAAGWDGAVVAVPGERLPPALVQQGDARQDLVADSARIRAELGYAERVGPDEALARTVAWERAHPPAAVDPTKFDYAGEDRAMAADE